MSEILLIDWLTGIGQTSLTFLVSAGLADRPSYEGSARVLNSRHWQQTVAVSEGISHGIMGTGIPAGGSLRYRK